MEKLLKQLGFQRRGGKYFHDILGMEKEFDFSATSREGIAYNIYMKGRYAGREEAKQRIREAIGIAKQTIEESIGLKDY